MWSSILDFSPIQVKNPFMAGQSLPQPGLPGAYSVELVCHTLTSLICRLTIDYLWDL